MSKAKYAFGIDVGGTTVKCGLFDAEGELLEKWEIPTRTEDNGRSILPDIAQTIKDKAAEKKISKEEVLGVGIDVPGPVLEGGVVNICVNLGWGVVNVKDDLSEMLGGVRVEVGNDANVAALGEYWKGGGQGFSSMVIVTLGTGVGGGIIIDGKILSGFHGAGAEIGHMTVNYDEADVCNCGRKGCLEQYASATGITRMAHRRLAKNRKKTVLENNDELSAKKVFDAAKDGDAVALEVVDDFGRILGRALANLAVVVDPEVYVIGGGVSKAGQIVLDAIEKYYKDAAFHSCKTTPFRTAKLGNDAGMYGAVKLLLG